MLYCTYKNPFQVDAASRVLKEFDNCARSINVDYCMVGGTLLGCIRHGCFMSWDDDIDLLMRIDDMERLWESHIYDDAQVMFLEIDAPVEGRDAFERFDNPVLGPNGYFEWLVRLGKDGIYIDVWPYKISKDEQNIDTFIGKFPLNKTFPYRMIDFEGSVYSIPNDPNYFLDRVFPDWRDTIVRRIDGHEGNLVSRESFFGPIRHQF